MEAVKLAGLEPASVFGYFEKLCSMPHGSGNTRIISDYLVSFAKEQNIPYIQDELNNVILFGPASEGYEDHESVIIQGHMDMVCEKDPDCTINFDTDGLDITHDGQYVFANGTTLGGDDGIAVAYALALLADKSILHCGSRYGTCGVRHLEFGCPTTADDGHQGRGLLVDTKVAYRGPL